MITGTAAKPAAVVDAQAALHPSVAAAACPWVRARTEFTIIVTGWLAAKDCSHPGMLETGT